MRELKGPTRWSFRGFWVELDEGDRICSRLPWVITLLPFGWSNLIHYKMEQCTKEGKFLDAWFLWALNVPIHFYVHIMMKIRALELYWNEDAAAS